MWQGDQRVVLGILVYLLRNTAAQVGPSQVQVFCKLAIVRIGNCVKSVLGVEVFRNVIFQFTTWLFEVLVEEAQQDIGWDGSVVFNDQLLPLDQCGS